jgi:hypothetical protein
MDQFDLPSMSTSSVVIPFLSARPRVVIVLNPAPFDTEPPIDYLASTYLVLLADCESDVIVIYCCFDSILDFVGRIHP